MKPIYDTQTMSAPIAKDQTFQIDAADIIVLQGKSALDDTFDVSEDGGVTWRSVSARESVTVTSGQPVHVRAVNSNMVVGIERKTLPHFQGDEGERLPIVTATTGPGGGSRLLAGNLPADMAQLSNVVVSDGALQSWTANGIDYVATYAGGKVATVTTSDGWVQTYTWAGDVPTITVARV